jgi:hypothetical protein
MQRELKDVCADWLNAKQEETLANARRIALETELIALTGKPDEGAQTIDESNFKIKLEQKINRKLDSKKWALVVDQIPETLRPVTIVEEYKIEAKGVRWLKDNEPGYYKLLCSAMEEKPAKTSVKIEVKE